MMPTVMTQRDVASRSRARTWLWQFSAPHYGWLHLVLLGLLYAFLTALILRQGFLEYNADGYTRIIHGYEWRQAPRWEVDVWLPLQTWLFGLGLMVHDSLTITPRAMDIFFTAWSVANLYAIGRALAGTLAGLLAAAIAVLFPWTVWLGASGMSEPLFHALLTAAVLGFVRWLIQPHDGWLALAAGGLLLASMVRYEGWFYAAVYAPLLIGLALRRGLLRPSVVALALLPLAFPLLWMQQHWQQHGDPLWFARETAAVKEALAGENAGSGIVRRLTVYPAEVARLAPRLAALTLLATAYVLLRRVWWWPLVALIAGQALLFISVSAAFSNLGPGAERYLLSNALLLFPVLAATIVQLGSRSRRVAGLLALALCLWPLLSLFSNPPDDYPDGATRAVAGLARSTLERDAAGGDRIPVLLPAEQEDGFNASYALRILSHHPDAWLFTADPALFQAWVATTNPPFWVVDTASGASAPPAARIEQIQRFTLGWPPDQAVIQLEPTSVAPAGTLALTATGFAAGEQTQAWLTSPDGTALAIEWVAAASADGAVSGAIDVPIDARAGAWSVTIRGVMSQVTGQAGFTVIEGH